MDLSPQDRRTPVRKSGTPVGSRIAAWLRARHPNKTALHVAAETGIDPETVARLIARGSVPEGLNLWRLIRAYGPAFAAECLPEPPQWLSAAAHADRLAAAEQAARAAIDEITRLKGQQI